MQSGKPTSVHYARQCIIHFFCENSNAIGVRGMLLGLMPVAQLATECAPLPWATTWSGPQANCGGVLSWITVSVAVEEIAEAPGINSNARNLAPLSVSTGVNL